ncbi:MAG: TonB-dependent receptor plug domain-containing protein [Cyclobacteriaceae bacterium]|nr:TonB-dependent receptor plug domain-containing protein [Cyclobacteriaceae bacterium]
MQPKEKKIVDRGYGVAYDSDIAQSTKSTNPNEKAPSNQSLTDMIMAKPGVTMTSQGIRIGGIGSFSNSDPLFVINGSAVSATYDQIVAMINPNDIVSITVLKGPDASIYGSRAGNGVILIRTK